MHFWTGRERATSALDGLVAGGWGSERATEVKPCTKGNCYLNVSYLCTVRELDTGNARSAQPSDEAKR